MQWHSAAGKTNLESIQIKSLEGRDGPLTDDITDKMLRHQRMAGLVKLRCSA